MNEREYEREDSRVKFSSYSQCECSVDLERIEASLDELSSDGIHIKHYNVVCSHSPTILSQNFPYLFALLLFISFRLYTLKFLQFTFMEGAVVCWCLVAFDSNVDVCEGIERVSQILWQNGVQYCTVQPQLHHAHDEMEEEEHTLKGLSVEAKRRSEHRAAAPGFDLSVEN